MKYCAECGSKIGLETAKFCPDCGASILMDLTPEDSQSPSDNASERVTLIRYQSNEGILNASVISLTIQHVDVEHVL